MKDRFSENQPKIINRIFFVFSLLCCSHLTQAALMVLPESDRPDAARPQSNITPHQLPTTDADIVDIPAVIDRPFDTEEGPYVVVNQFRLINAEDYPDLNIKVANIHAILEKLKAEQAERGFSIGELQEVADKVTDYYRAKGLILSTAIIPDQTVVDGIVDIQVLVGKLGRVLVENNKDYSERILRRPFNQLLGQPVTQQSIEAALLTLTYYPGLSVFGVFQPGLKVGDSDIVLKVQEEKWYDVALRLDNHGLDNIGRDRFRTTASWNNPLGLADMLTATYQQAYSPKRNRFLALDYAVHLGWGLTLGLSTLKNEFSLGGDFSLSDIQTETNKHLLYLDKNFILSRQLNFSSRLSFSRKESITKSGSFETSSDRLSVIALDFNYDSVDTFHPLRSLIKKIMPAGSSNFGGGLNFATLTYSRGFNGLLGAMGSGDDQLATGRRSSRTGGSGRRAEGQFDKLDFSYQRLQLMTKNTSVLFKTEFQWSNDMLVPLEQYSVGGAENVRGYPDGQALFDRAWFFSLAYVWNIPFFWNQSTSDTPGGEKLLQFSIFYDFATGRQNDPLNLTDDPNTSGHWNALKSIGTGLRFNLSDTIDSHLIYAVGIGDPQSTDGRSDRILIDFTYSF